MTVVTNTEELAFRSEFEQQAYSGYISRGIGDTDGWYHPIDKTAFTCNLRLQVPVNPGYFKMMNNTEFRPTEEMCARYNATFIGKPSALRLAIRMEKGWKTTEVSGTENAHEFLCFVAEEWGFHEARLEDYAMLDGYWVPQIVEIAGMFVKGNKAITDKKKIRRGDFLGVFARLLQNSETLELDC